LRSRTGVHLAKTTCSPLAPQSPSVGAAPCRWQCPTSESRRAVRRVVPLSWIHPENKPRPALNRREKPQLVGFHWIVAFPHSERHWVVCFSLPERLGNSFVLSLFGRSTIAPCRRSDRTQCAFYRP